jgi:threonine dehydratase
MSMLRSANQAWPPEGADSSGTDLATQVNQQVIRSIEPLIRPYVRHTPVITIGAADFGLPGGPLVLKLEHLQHSGSFKARGAFANLLLRDIPPAGVVAASGGNHGAAVAYAANALGIPARIYVPEVSSPAKIARIRSYGTDLVLVGETYGEALAASEEWIATSGALAVHAFDQPETMLGAGTVGLELAGQAPAAAHVVASVGGGGLLGGIAAWYSGQVRITGAEPEDAPTLTEALKAGRPVDAKTGSIAVDSLAPRRIGDLAFAVLTATSAESALVSDDEIRHAQQLLWDRMRLVAEPGGCAALAAVLAGRIPSRPDETLTVVISGANTTAVNFTD